MKTPETELIKELLLWARQERIQLGRLKVGEVELELLDLELATAPAPEATGADWSPKNPPEHPEDMYAELARQRGMNVDRDELAAPAEDE